MIAEISFPTEGVNTSERSSGTPIEFIEVQSGEQNPNIEVATIHAIANLWGPQVDAFSVCSVNVASDVLPENKVALATMADQYITYVTNERVEKISLLEFVNWLNDSAFKYDATTALQLYDTETYYYQEDDNRVYYYSDLVRGSVRGDSIVMPAQEIQSLMMGLQRLTAQGKTEYVRKYIEALGGVSRLLENFVQEKKTAQYLKRAAIFFAIVAGVGIATPLITSAINSGINHGSLPVDNEAGGDQALAQLGNAVGDHDNHSSAISPEEANSGVFQLMADNVESLSSNLDVRLLSSEDPNPGGLQVQFTYKNPHGPGVYAQGKYEDHSSQQPIVEPTPIIDQEAIALPDNVVLVSAEDWNQSFASVLGFPLGNTGDSMKDLEVGVTDGDIVSSDPSTYWVRYLGGQKDSQLVISFDPSVYDHEAVIRPIEESTEFLTKYYDQSGSDFYRRNFAIVIEAGKGNYAVRFDRIIEGKIVGTVDYVVDNQGVKLAGGDQYYRQLILGDYSGHDWRITIHPSGDNVKGQELSLSRLQLDRETLEYYMNSQEILASFQPEGGKW